MVQPSRQTLGISVRQKADSGVVRRPAVLEPFRRDGFPCFDVYRAEPVQLTSTLSGGGDWHWRLTSVSGDVLADCGGYRNQRDCLAAAKAVRAAAAVATISGYREQSQS